MKKLEDKKYTHKGYTVIKCERGSVYDNNRAYYYMIKKGKEEIRGFYSGINTLSYAIWTINQMEEA
jgi:hypothetical protein